MKAQDIMTDGPTCCTPEDTVERAAKLMTENDCGCLPVVSDMDRKGIVGVVTDRDLACRCLGEGKGAETQVSEVMSANPSSEPTDAPRSNAEKGSRPGQNRGGCC